MQPRAPVTRKRCTAGSEAGDVVGLRRHSGDPPRLVGVYFAFALVMIAVPVSTFFGTFLPVTAAYSVAMPSEPIFAGMLRDRGALGAGLDGRDLVRLSRRTRPG